MEAQNRAKGVQKRENAPPKMRFFARLQGILTAFRLLLCILICEIA
jgi:hypothetical protein